MSEKDIDLRKSILEFQNSEESNPFKASSKDMPSLRRSVPGALFNTDRTKSTKPATLFKQSLET